MKRIYPLVLIVLLSTTFFVATPQRVDACGLFSDFDLTTCVVAPAATLLLKTTSLLTQLSGVTLNSVIGYTVLDMSKHYKMLPAIGESWGTIRDIANMGFIFVLLYAAIETILGVGSDNKKLIVSMVVAAILINFSLFFTQLVIDAGNIISITFYNVIAPNAVAPDGTLLSMTSGLSNAYVNALSLPSLFDAPALGAGNIVTVGIMGSIVLLIAAFNFFAVALLLIIRYAVLIFVLILSPIVFVSGILPELSKYRTQWVSALTGQAFFPAVYFLLTWISLRILNDLGNSLRQPNSPPNWPNSLGATSYQPGFIGLIIMFGVAIVFMVASIVIAKQFADRAGSGISKLTSGALGKAGAATYGMTGRLGRQSLGRFGQMAADSEFLKKRAPNNMTARLALKASQKTAKSSFDMRATGIGAALGSGKAQKGGFAQDLKDHAKAEKEFSDTFKPSELLVHNAERELEAAKLSHNQARIDKAQDAVDYLKGRDDKRIKVLKDQAAKAKDAAITSDSDVQAEAQLKKDITNKQAEIEDEERRIGLSGDRTTLESLKLQKANMESLVAAQTDAANERRRVIEEAYKTQIEEIDKTKNQGAGQRRKEAYAANMADGPKGIKWIIPDSDRLLYWGPVSKEAKTAAMEIRKSNKAKDGKAKAAEALKELAKEEGPKVDDDSTTPAPAAPAPATPPPTTP